MRDYLLKRLECFKDPDFIFNPGLHRYTYHGDVFQSVTTLVGTFHKPFETEKMSKKKADETGFDQEWIKKEWTETNRYANEVGTATHEWIENYFEEIWQPLPTNPEIIHRINKFNKIFAKQLHKLEPLAFEVRVFSKKWKKAGTIDALFIKDGKLYILDWKTNKKFTDDEHRDGKYQKLLWPFDSFYKNHHNEYSIQLSIYAAILEEWGFDVAGAYLVYIGPGDEEAELIKVKDMRPYIDEYFNRGMSIE
jgi:ATP-dependent exoDNAse (exonuclease V) beta subunit